MDTGVEVRQTVTRDSIYSYIEFIFFVFVSLPMSVVDIVAFFRFIV